MNIRIAKNEDIPTLFKLNRPVQKIHAEMYPHIFHAEPAFDLFEKDFTEYLA